MNHHTPPNIVRALKGRFLAARLIIIIVPLICCVVVTLGLSFRVMDRYAENFEALGGREQDISPAEILGAHLPLLFYSGAAFMVFVTALIFFVHGLLKRQLTNMLLRPLDALSLGMERLRDSRESCRLDTPGGIFRPLYGAFNEAAAALEGGAPDPRPPLDRLREGLADIRRALDTASTGQKKILEPVEQKLAALEWRLDEILLFLALNRGEFLLDRKPLELGHFLQDIAGEAAARWPGMILNIVENREAIRIFTDGPWLREAAIRLLSYYLTHWRLGTGRVIIRYRQRAKRRDGPKDTPLAELILINKGAGVSEETLPTLFERPGFFYAPDVPTGMPPDGEKYGLSLALAARIIKNLGGSIYAEKSSLGGLAIVICFPLWEGDGG